MRCPERLRHLQQAWEEFSPTRAPLVVGAAIGDVAGAPLPDLADVGWIGMYPLAVMMLAGNDGSPRTQEPRRHLEHTIMEEVEKERLRVRHEFRRFIALWNLDQLLEVPTPVGEYKGAKAEYYQESEHLFGASFFRKRQDLDNALIRWRSAPFVTKRKDGVPVCRLVESRTIDLVLSELLSNGFTHGIPTASRGGITALMCKVTGVDSAKAALAAHDEFEYLTEEEWTYLDAARRHGVPLLEVVVFDNGGGLRGKESFGKAFATVKGKNPANDAELIAFALEGHYSSKTAIEVAREPRHYPEIDHGDVIPEIHGLGELRRIVRESRGYWRIHSNESVLELNYQKAWRFDSRACANLRYFLRDEGVIKYLAAQPRFMTRNLAEFYTRLVKGKDAPEALSRIIPSVADAAVARINPSARPVQGTIHHLVLPLDDFEWPVATEAPRRRHAAVDHVRPEPIEMASVRRPRLEDLALGLGTKRKLDELLEHTNRIVHRLNRDPEPAILNLQALEKMRESELDDAVAIVAHGLNRLSRGCAVYLSGMTEPVSSRLRRIRCLSSFFTDRRIIPIVTAAYDRNSYDVDIMTAAELDPVRDRLRKALSLMHGNFCSFSGLSPELVTLLVETQRCNQAYLMPARDAAEVGLAGRVQLQERDAQTFRYLFGAESTRDFALRLQRGHAIRIGPNLRFRRYGREVDYYVHLASMCGDAEFVRSFHNWMFGALLHTPGMGPFLRARGRGLAFICVLEPAIQLTRGFINRYVHFSGAEILAVRRLSELTWDSPDLMNLRAEACVVVIDVCQSYSTLDTILRSMRALGTEVISTVAGLAAEKQPQHGHVASYADLAGVLKELRS